MGKMEKGKITDTASEDKKAKKVIGVLYGIGLLGVVGGGAELFLVKDATGLIILFAGLIVSLIAVGKDTDKLLISSTKVEQIEKRLKVNKTVVKRNLKRIN
jgi:hypothetical protein